MRVAVFHYHLQPGGVTDVVIDSVRAVCLSNAQVDGESISEVTLVCGREDNVEHVVARITTGPDQRSGILDGPGGPITITADVLPILEYTSPTESEQEAEQRTAAIEAMLVDRYAGGLWWVHNYHLGKNPSFTRALCRLVERGEGPDRLLLHIHDFPESARYENLAYLNRIAGPSPYPTGPTVRYATINPHDQRALAAALANAAPRGVTGADASPPAATVAASSDRADAPGVGLLLNPLPGGSADASDESPDRADLVRGFSEFARITGQRFHEDGPILLYPVRTIRRKNVLELGLISRLLPGANLITTLPGTSDAERPYSELVEYAYTDRRIHGIWGIGRREDEVGLSFKAITRGADLIMSSSVQEGFGLTFVNALLWKAPIVARRLDVLDGIDELFAGYPDSFYSSFLVPSRSPSITSMGGYLRMRYQERLDAIGNALPESVREPLETEIEALVSGDTVEFSYLPAQMQLTVLGDIRDEGYGSFVRTLNGEVFTAVDRALSESDSRPPDKASDLERLLGYESYARTFESIVNGPAPAPTAGRHAAAQESLQHEFATLSRLRLLLGPIDHHNH